jgi:LysR family transcriptional regulator, transcriptional activator of the cysJI operon
MAQLENFRLKVFRVVAEHLSFHKAAEYLFLTQPAVTRQIKALENDLGLRLFDRTTSKVLTRQGSVLLGYAEKLAQLVSEAERELIPDDGQPSGELSLGASTTIAQYVLPCLLRIFLEENPRVQISLRSGNTREIVRLLLENKVSLGLIEGPARARGVHPEPFVEDELALITPLKFESERLSSGELSRFTLLLREHGSGSRRVVESALEKAGLKLKSFKKVMELDSTEAIKSGVEVGLGVGFVSRWALAKELELGVLKIVPVDGIRITRHFTLISRTSPEPQGLVDIFRLFTLRRAAYISKVRKKTNPTT